MPFPLSCVKLNIICFQQFSLFQFAKSLSAVIFKCKRYHIHMQGDVDHDMYPILAV